MKGSIRERRPKVWNLCVELPPGPGGKRRQKNFTVYGAKRDAQRRLREILTELDQGKYTPPGKTTVGQFLTEWQERLKVAPSTESMYRSISKNHLLPGLGRIVLSKLTKDDLEQFYYALPRAPSTVKLIHVVLTVALNDAVARNLINTNPAIGADRPSFEPEVAEFLEHDELDRILKAMRGSRNYPAVMVAATTGLRVGEVAGLKWVDFSAKTGKLSVRRSVVRLPGGELVINSSLKTKHSRRTISLPAATIRTLREHRWRQYRTYQPLGFRPEFIFPSTEGGIPSPDLISQAFTRVCQKLGIKASFHALRHTHASQLIEAGVQLKVISERLGHASINITADLYGHLLRGVDEQAANAINKHFV